MVDHCTDSHAASGGNVVSLIDAVKSIRDNKQRLRGED
jgi:hypothetical protein